MLSAPDIGLPLLLISESECDDLAQMQPHLEQLPPDSWSVVVSGQHF